MASYQHSIQPFPTYGFYRLIWYVDHHYPDSRQRFPRRHTRDTDEAGARRFAKKHGVTFPQYSQVSGNEGR